MTLIENRIDAALCELRTMRGAFMIISEAKQLDAQDYDGLTGQIESYACIAEKQLENLDRVIKDLSKVAPKQENTD